MMHPPLQYNWNKFPIYAIASNPGASSHTGNVHNAIHSFINVLKGILMKKPKRHTNLKNQAFYYLKDNFDRPRITVCLAQDHAGNIAKGISICSVTEPVVKKEGRKHALHYAQRALKLLKCDYFISRDEAYKALEEFDEEFATKNTNGWKAYFEPNFKGHNSLEAKIIESWCN
jgi:hypothetical protein